MTTAPSAATRHLPLLLAGALLSGAARAAPQERITNTIGITFSLIPAGSFTMGSAEGESGAESDEQPRHQVTISAPFYLGVHEVTQAQWRSIMGANPSRFHGDDHPVESISWDDVQQFIAKLNALEGTHLYRLPSEAEWEYGCREGGASHAYSGNRPIRQIAWSNEEYADGHRPVGEKEANAFGLYDMSGNVYEWVLDTYKPDGYSRHAEADPVIGELAQDRVNRGGSWSLPERFQRCANRSHDTATYGFSNVGFRLMRALR